MVGLADPRRNGDVQSLTEHVQRVNGGVDKLDLGALGPRTHVAREDGKKGTRAASGTQYLLRGENLSILGRQHVGPENCEERKPAHVFAPKASTVTLTTTGNELGP